TGDAAGDMVGGNNGVLLDGATFTSAGAAGGAVQFSSMAFNRVEAENRAGLLISGPLSVEALVNLGGPAHPIGIYAPIVGKWGTLANEAGYLLSLAPGTTQPAFAISLDGASTAINITGPALSTNAWHHLVGTYDGGVLK